MATPRSEHTHTHNVRKDPEEILLNVKRLHILCNYVCENITQKDLVVIVQHYYVLTVVSPSWLTHIVAHCSSLQLLLVKLAYCCLFRVIELALAANLQDLHNHDD